MVGRAKECQGPLYSAHRLQEPLALYNNKEAFREISLLVSSTVSIPIPAYVPSREESLET